MIHAAVMRARAGSLATGSSGERMSAMQAPAADEKSTIVEGARQTAKRTRWRSGLPCPRRGLGLMIARFEGTETAIRCWREGAMRANRSRRPRWTALRLGGVHRQRKARSAVEATAV